MAWYSFIKYIHKEITGAHKKAFLCNTELHYTKQINVLYGVIISKV